MGLIKIFSGNEILALSLQQKIEEIGVNTVIRNNNQANVIPSIQTEKAMELFIQEIDFGKANLVIEEFRLSI
jgi:Putative prokaryotic signal transducing protein